MPAIDILQFVERFITAFCGFFSSVVVSVCRLICCPKSAVPSLNERLGDAEAQQVGGLTLIFLTFAIPAFLIFQSVTQPEVNQGEKGGLAHWLAVTAEGAVDDLEICTIIFALVATGCIDFFARCAVWVGNDRSGENIIRGRDLPPVQFRRKLGEMRYALFTPALAAIILAILGARMSIGFINGTHFSRIDFILITMLIPLFLGRVRSVGHLVFSGTPDKKAGPLFLDLGLLAAFSVSIPGGCWAALFAYHGLTSGALGDARGVSVEQPICEIRGPGKPHLSAVFINRGQATVALSSGATISVSLPFSPNNPANISFRATTAEQEGQAGGIIILKGGDAVAVDFVANTNTPIGRYADMATGCILEWQLYGGYVPEAATAKMSAGQNGALEPR